MKKDNTLIQSFCNFLGDTEGLTDDDLIMDLKEQGIDPVYLEKRVEEVVRDFSKKRRLAWQDSAQQRRIEIENYLKDRKVASKITNLKSKIADILAGSYGQGALSYAEAYFRKNDAITEKDMESLVEDLEDLNLLEKLDNKE